MSVKSLRLFTKENQRLSALCPKFVYQHFDDRFLVQHRGGCLWNHGCHGAFTSLRAPKMCKTALPEKPGTPSNQLSKLKLYAFVGFDRPRAAYLQNIFPYLYVFICIYASGRQLRNVSKCGISNSFGLCSVAHAQARL